MALTNAQRQRRYRARRKAQQPRAQYYRPQDRRSDRSVGRMRCAPCSTSRTSIKRGSTTCQTLSRSLRSHRSWRRSAGLILPNWRASSRRVGTGATEATGRLLHHRPRPCAGCPRAAGVGQFPSGALPALPRRLRLRNRLGCTHPAAATPPQAGILPVPARNTRSQRPCKAPPRAQVVAGYLLLNTESALRLSVPTRSTR